MKRHVEVVFKPWARKVRVTPGTTVFQAAKEGGVRVRTECGGHGECGKCRIVAQDKSALSAVTRAERDRLSSSEIDSGYRLACQAAIRRDIAVMIPPESRIGALEMQVTGLERPVPLNPLVKKLRVLLPKPALSDVRSDFERLLDCLKSEYNFGELEIDYQLLRELPDVLRNTNWDITVVVWNDREIIAVEKGNTLDKLFGSAVDIGTSKIVVYVVDLITGRTVGTGSTENPQVIHGEDVISRITFAMDNDERLGMLQNLIVGGINDALRDARAAANVDPHNIYEATVVGNTAMHHSFLAIQPKYVSLSPFTPATSRPVDVKARELKVRMHPNGVIHVLPVIAGFVGADAVGDVLSSGIYESKELSLLVDIGTNTEVFVGNAEDILCCSCASGPAFEGANIKYGMKAVTGAIEKVRINPDSYEVEYETIGGVGPVGLCGSAIVDVVAEMLKCRIINHRGKFNLDIETPRFKTSNKDIEFVIAHKDETEKSKTITVTQRDISEIQLAKAAISTGCSILMTRKKLKKENFDRVFIAGAFGSRLNPENAAFLGLIPDIPTEKIKFVGNTAVAGAKMVLVSREMRETAQIVSNRIRYLELTTDPRFSKEFAAAMFIPHKNLDRFQSVKEYLHMH